MRVTLGLACCMQAGVATHVRSRLLQLMSTSHLISSGGILKCLQGILMALHALQDMCELV